MKLLAAFVFLFASMAVATAADHVAIARAQAAFAMISPSQPCALCAGCICVDCNCEALQKRLAEAKAKHFQLKTPPQTMTKTITTTRPAQGHSHTCGKCGTTWDHAAVAGHNCPNCGTPQFVIDRPTRPVTIRKTIQVPVAAPKTAPPPTMTLSALQRSAVSLNGCPPSG
jgi:DNA-directed RNA polymerase subunit RPC12/RpoP